MQKSLHNLIKNLKSYMVLSAVLVMLAQVLYSGETVIDLFNTETNNITCENIVEPPREVGKDFII